MGKLSFVDYDEIFLSLSWKWLTDPEIKYLTCTSVMTKEEQRRWFLSLNNRKDYFIKGILMDGMPVGVCGLKHIDSVAGEYWGYIGEREWWGKGIGKQMLFYIEQYARSLGLRRVYLHVLKDNTRACKLYINCGYKKESLHGDLFEMTKTL